MEECQCLYLCDISKDTNVNLYKLFRMDVSPHDYLEDIPIEDTPKPTLEETTPPPVEDASRLQAPCEEPQISLDVMSSFSTPQTLKLIGYIKHCKVIVLIESGSTHNFFHRRVAQETHCYLRPIPNFQIMNVNDGTMKCVGQCENVKLQIGEYHLKNHMFSIEMGGCEIVLEEEWLCTLGLVTMDLKELYMSFTHQGNKHTLKGITYGFLEIITSHCMEKLFNKGHSSIIT